MEWDGIGIGKDPLNTMHFVI